MLIQTVSYKGVLKYVPFLLHIMNATLVYGTFFVLEELISSPVIILVAVILITSNEVITIIPDSI